MTSRYEVVGAINASAAEDMVPGKNQIIVEKEDGSEWLIARPKDGGDDA